MTVVPLMPAHKDFHVDRPNVTFAFSEQLNQSLVFASTYIVGDAWRDELYIGETSNIKRRHAEHLNSMKLHGFLDTSARFGQGTHLYDLVFSTWHLPQSNMEDEQFRLLHEHLLGVRFESKNTGHIGRPNARLYGYVFTLPDGRYIHCFYKNLFFVMHGIPMEKRLTNLRRRGITMRNATRYDVFEAYASAFR
ncbi:TPA: hypothetical protein ACQYCV_001429 [Vibrio parahaemolyticus]|uniref:hypothetical protein n=1 Tax=Vibrio parahaemolyticus TaxID=670 RepID=UPI001DF5C202|nr:hypothetical protein [Vibrio parahaemolyticus]EGQ8919490.1 hypothetical protein [Vibrio parahaemolyticus]EHH1101849.1 hypothetical protein [Vibrio parahaemolyticus]MCG9644969.1 hypothetical protein [Vibrio parahaemolyticus]HCE2382706.1 hypothetical protein [Vibrio parahaemolyticus]